jgi:hypothetical protein
LFESIKFLTVLLAGTINKSRQENARHIYLPRSHNCTLGEGKDASFGRIHGDRHW